MENVTKFVNKGNRDAIVKIDQVEAKYNATYVGQLCLRDRYGNWANEAAEVFYQPVPPVEGYSNYLALFVRDGSLYITSGASAVEGIIDGVQAEDGEIIYSRYRHDCRKSTDGTTWIDGGRDYTRGGFPHKGVRLKIVDGEWYAVSAEEE